MEGPEDKPSQEGSKEAVFAKSLVNIFNNFFNDDNSMSIPEFLTNLSDTVMAGHATGATESTGFNENEIFILSARFSTEVSREARKNILLDALEECKLEKDPYLEILRSIKTD